MKKISEFLAIVLVAALVAQPMVAMAGSPNRLVPTGNVSVLANGKEVNRFKSEMPLPEGLLMACSGSCLVQTQGLQLVAQDQAVFALTDGEKNYDMTVKSGRVDFAIRAEAKPVAFHTPQDLIRAEQAIVPAGTNGLVRGYVTVSDTGTELNVQEGALQVVSQNGTQTVKPGQPMIILAQAQMNGEKDKKDKKAAGAVVAGGGAAGAAAGGGGLSTTAMVIGGVMAAGIAGGVAAAAATTGDEGGHHQIDVSPGAD